MSTPPDDHGWSPEVKPRSGHSGRPRIDKILKEARRGDLESVKRHLNQEYVMLICGQYSVRKSPNVMRNVKDRDPFVVSLNDCRINRATRHHVVRNRL